MIARTLLLTACFSALNPCDALPRITVHPSPATNSVSIGATLSNRVTATTTNGPLSFQWLFDAADVLGATNASLVLTNLQLASAGRYTVRVADADGSVESNPWVVDVDGTF